MTNVPAQRASNQVSMEPETGSRLTELLASAPPGKWVALSFDETKIVAVADTFGDAARAAELEGETEPVIWPIPRSGWRAMSL